MAHSYRNPVELLGLDHEGDNFLGGTDFDRLIVEKLVVPKLQAGF